MYILNYVITPLIQLVVDILIIIAIVYLIKLLKTDIKKTNQFYKEMRNRK